MSPQRKTMWDHKPASAYHPLFYEWWDLIEKDFEHLSALERESSRDYECMDMLQRAFERLKSWCSQMRRERNLYILYMNDQNMYLRADEIPFDQEFRLILKLFDYMKHHCSNVSQMLAKIPLYDYIEGLLPYLVWGGYSATLFYEMLVRLYDMEKEMAMTFMEKLFEYAQNTSNEDVRHYLRGAFHYFRLKRGQTQSV